MHGTPPGSRVERRPPSWSQVGGGGGVAGPEARSLCAGSRQGARRRRPCQAERSAARAIWVVEDAPGEVLALRSTPIRLLPFCSFPLPICAHPLVSQRIIIIIKKFGRRFKEKESGTRGLLHPRFRRCGAHVATVWPSWLLAPVPEAVIQLDRPGLCILLHGGYRGASCTSQVARKTFSFSFHLCQCCLQTPKGIFRKLIIKAMESEHE